MFKNTNILQRKKGVTLITRYLNNYKEEKELKKFKKFNKA
jgi:hypothetical protein